MTVLDVKTARKPTVIETEIRALDNLIDRRQMWLNKPENKLRKTYQAVLQDTLEMECKLLELRKELEEAETN